MQYVDFYGHKISKLIVGDNPINGHSYIPDFIDGEEMTNYYTEEKVLEAMHKMEELGINTMLPLADPFILRILKHYRSNGGKMNFIFQPFGAVLPEVSIRHMLELGAIGIYVHADYNFETNQNEATLERLALYREKMSKEYGVKVGLSTHRPEVIEKSEKDGWDFDFYMACMYNLRRNHEGELSGFITGKPKTGHNIIPSDRPEMLKVLKDVKKPIIAFKIFAGGQMLVEANKEQRHDLIKDAYNTIFNSLKPDDFAAMGVFQKYFDQLSENVSIFNEWAENK